MEVYESICGYIGKIIRSPSPLFPSLSRSSPRAWFSLVSAWCHFAAQGGKWTVTDGVIWSVLQNTVMKVNGVKKTVDGVKWTVTGIIVLSYAPSVAAVWQCDRVRAMCESNSVRHKSLFKALGLAPLGVLW